MLGENLELLFGNSCAILSSRLRLCLSSFSGNRSRVDSAQAGPFLLLAVLALHKNSTHAKPAWVLDFSMELLTGFEPATY